MLAFECLFIPNSGLLQSLYSLSHHNFEQEYTLHVHHCEWIYSFMLTAETAALNKGGGGGGGGDSWTERVGIYTVKDSLTCQS